MYYEHLCTNCELVFTLDYGSEACDNCGSEDVIVIRTFRDEFAHLRG